VDLTVDSLGGWDRVTHDTNNPTSLPGSLVRNESSGPSGDAVLDEAHCSNESGALNEAMSGPYTGI
jgi:Zn-dependent metalloprotease